MTQQQGEQRIPPTIIYIIMQQEDDLRALAKIMEFGRAVSIFILVVHVYVYCYPSMSAWHLNLDVIDRILMNFDRTTGIFGCILWTKLMAVLLLAISCMGTIGVKGEKITWQRIWAVLTAGAVLFFMNWWLLDLPFPHEAITALYVVTLAAGYLCLLMAGLWISRLYRHNLMEDVFNMENESFMQETRLMENEYSVNLPTRFQYGGKLNDGWINVVNPFRATIVLGTPGSGKSYAVVNNYIKQMISKGFSVYIYDYKFDDLSTIAYNTLLHNMDKYKVKPHFYVINFDDPHRSHRCNPINPEFMTDISDAYEASYTIMLNLNRTWIEKQGDSCVIRYEDHENKGVTSAEFIEGQSSDALVSCTDAENQNAAVQKERAHAVRKERKDTVKIALYKLLVKLTGKTLPWGNLTGIRPAKLAMGLIESGMKNTEAAQEMRERYMVSPQKTALAITIANREREILKDIDYENGYSLYVGIPFCPTVCSYCSFSSGALGDWEYRVEDYLAALMKELEAIAKMSEGRKADTIYMGGGTPTTLNADQLDRLLTCIDRHFVREGLLEFTVEAGRPDSITKEKLQVLRNHGINRISINPQSMQQKTLDTIGRKHTVEQVYEAFHMARKLGFDNINMDIIAGLPGETPEDMEDTLRQIALLGPDNLTVHSLAIKRAAKMGQEEREGKRLTIIQDEIGTMVEMAGNKARQMGLFPYYLYRQKNIAGNFENVGYAKVDKAGIYNILIMEEKQSIIAAGAGASTKIVLKEPVINPESKKKKKTSLIRQENVKAIDAYISRVDEMIERKGEWLWR